MQWQHMLICNYNELDRVLRYLTRVICSQDMNMQVNVTRQYFTCTSYSWCTLNYRALCSKINVITLSTTFPAILYCRCLLRVTKDA